MSDKHWENQPRVPAGNANGGEWVGNNSKLDAANQENKNTSPNTTNIPQNIIEYCDSLSAEEVNSTIGYSFFNRRGEDKILKNIISMQKYDEFPKVVSEEELTGLLKSGYVGFTRGMRIQDGADKYRTGDMFIGRGTSGSGVYATAFSNGEKFTDQATAIKNARMYSGVYDEPYTGSILIGVLAKDTKIISKGELARIKNEIAPSLSDNAKRIFSNDGNLAVALGYDAIDCGTKSYVIILNRGKTIVAK